MKKYQTILLLTLWATLTLAVWFHGVVPFCHGKR